MTAFDPDAAAQPGSGIFGLPHGQNDAEVWLMPVPFQATVSYGGGTADGPAAILDASAQVDLFDPQTGRPYERGIWMMAAAEVTAIRRHSDQAREIAEPILERGGAAAGENAAVAAVDDAGEFVNAQVRGFAESALQAGRLCGIVGGDHSVPFGAIAAAAEAHDDLGILHVDAHMDLREAYEGFTWSHASIMHNVLTRVPRLRRLVQVGIRDVGAREVEFANFDPRVLTHFDLTWRERMAAGETLGRLCKDAVDALPQQVWVSFDIDGLDPALCPGTGTPVPGGLQFHEACLLLKCLADSGREVVGFDLCEVAPATEWDGNVGARILYKLCGFGLLTR